MKITKKLAITLSTAMLCSVLSVHAAPSSTVPVGCPLKSTPCKTEKPCDPCVKPEPCDAAPVFNACEEIQQWKIKYCEKRVCIYDKLKLTQEQRVQAKCIDDKYFDEIAALKICCKKEKAKLKDMECKKCSWKDKHEQKQKIKDLKTEIKDKKKEHNECFMKILNNCQKDEYKKLMKDKCKKHCEPKCDCGCK